RWRVIHDAPHAIRAHLRIDLVGRISELELSAATDERDAMLRHQRGRAFIEIRWRVANHRLLRDLSPHSRGVGNTLPGLKIISGSNEQRTIFIVARSSSVNMSAIYDALSAPTPCSPVIDPPMRTHSFS